MKILYVTTISSTVNAFFKAHIGMLVQNGAHVDIACNYSGEPIDSLYTDLGCKFYQIDFSRSPISNSNVKAARQLRKVIEIGDYDIVHCHTPNASVITRFVCRKFRKQKDLRVLYTAHGFHFYKGAPLKNWLMYYPVEKFCSRFTDTLITINQEDYALAQKKMRAKRVEYVPGVGIDVAKFEAVQVDKKIKRKELGLPEDAVVLVSVGELSVRKNHRAILQALTKVDNKNIHYVIVGQGDLLSELQAYVREHMLEARVHFLGYRQDVAEIYKAADICCFPSIHEGLPVALMEAMACGLPAVYSRIRGNIDLLDEAGGIACEFGDADSYSRAIDDILTCDTVKMGEHNKACIKNYSLDQVITQMKTIYES